MVWRLTLWIAGGDVDYIEARYSDSGKVNLLEKIFPKSHWSAINPRAAGDPPEFDFIGNADSARKAIWDFRTRMDSSPEDVIWAEELLKTYRVGERLQKIGLNPRVSIG